MKFLKNFDQFKINEETTTPVVSDKTSAQTIWGNSSMTMNSYDENSKSGNFTFKSGDISISLTMKQLDTNINGFKMFEGDVVRFATELKQNNKLILDILDAANKPVANFNNVKLVFALKDGSKTPLTTTTRLGIFGKIGGQASGVKFLTNADGKVETANYKDDQAGYGFFVYQSSATYVNQPTSSFGNVSIKAVVIPQILPIKEAFIIDKVDLTDEAKKEITDKFSKLDKNTKLTINTGASKDNDNVQHDFDLITGRYKTSVAYLNSLGFKNVESINVPKDVNDTKNIYGKFNKDLKNPDNRNLVITPTK